MANDLIFMQGVAQSLHCKMSREKKYLIFGVPLMAVGGILLTLSLPILVTTRPPSFSYMVSSEDYDQAFYFLILGSGLSSIGLIFFGIHKAGIVGNSETRMIRK
jgi:hypothetical protein